MCTAVVVMRHGGASVAMNDAFWEKYEVPLRGSTAEKPNIPKRGAELRIITRDKAAAAAIHRFLLFQRTEHHAGH